MRGGRETRGESGASRGLATRASSPRKTRDSLSRCSRSLANLRIRYHPGVNSRPSANLVPPPASPLPAIVQTVCGSLLILALFSAALLRQPICLQDGRALGAIEAMFLALSAVTTNGLSIADPASTLGTLGCEVVLLLVMIGGTAMAVMAAWIIEELVASHEGTDGIAREGRGLIAWRITLLLFVLHLAGAALTLPMWRGGDIAERLLLSQTLAVDAVYRAGFWFSFQPLEPYRYDWVIHAAVVPLVVAGGLGYPVLRRVWHSWRNGKPLDGFARAGLSVAALVYGLGVIAIAGAQLAPYFYESLKLGTATNMPVMGPLTGRVAAATVADASLLAVSSQGVGLTTIPLDQLAPAAWLAALLLTVVGVASPLAVTALASHARGAVRGQPAPVDGVAIRCAAGVMTWFVMLVSVGLFALCLFEPYPFNKLLTEVVAACTSTGFSLGITAEVTAFGKIVLMLLMLGGAYGPPLLASAILGHSRGR